MIAESETNQVIVCIDTTPSGMLPLLKPLRTHFKHLLWFSQLADARHWLTMQTPRAVVITFDELSEELACLMTTMDSSTPVFILSDKQPSTHPVLSRGGVHHLRYSFNDDAAQGANLAKHIQCLLDAHSPAPAQASPQGLGLADTDWKLPSSQPHALERRRFRDRRAGKDRRSAPKRRSQRNWVFTLIGTPQIRAADENISLGAKRAVALIAYLKIQGGLHNREELIDLLWPEHVDARQAAGYFRTMLSRTKKKLPGLLTVTRSTVSLNEALCEWDVDDFMSLSTQADVTSLEQAARLYQAPFLDRLDIAASEQWQGWLEEQQECWFQRYKSVISNLVDLSMKNHQPRQAIRYLEQWINIDPYDSDAYHKNVMLHYQLGDKVSALAQYKQLERRLAEIGEQPSELLQQQVNNLN